MNRLPSRLALTLVAGLLGFLGIVQYRAEASSPALEGRSISELGAMIDRLARADSLLRDEKATASSDLAIARAGLAQTSGATSDGQVAVADLQAWAGLAPLRGAGIKVTIDGSLPGSLLEDVVADLWSGGPDGIAVGGVRIVPGVVVWGELGGTLRAGDTALSQPIAVTAVGDYDTLAAALRGPDGALAEIAAGYPAVTVLLEAGDSIVLPPTQRSLIPLHAQPHL